MLRTVAVTGIGVICCAGIGAGSFWDGLCRSVPEPQGTVRDFDPAVFLPPGQARRLDRVAQLGLAAAQLAMDGAGGDLAGDPRRCGVVFGTGFGGLGSLEEQVCVLQRDGPRRVSAYTVPMVMPNATTAAIAARARRGSGGAHPGRPRARARPGRAGPGHDPGRREHV